MNSSVQSPKPVSSKTPNKIVGIVGLGLIGGSFAKAYSMADWQVYATDIDKQTYDYACIDGTVQKELTSQTIPDCDLILICICPRACVDYLQEKASYISSNTIVIDCCGTKKIVYDTCSKVAKENNFTYVGGHPMAGTHHSGYKYATPDLFKDAPMVIVPSTYDDISLFDKVKTLLEPAHFGSLNVTTATEHDKTIAFTSQLAHVVSNAYIKSPTAQQHKGISAGSYVDLTRVAKLNPNMWTELFLENKENLIFEIDCLINNLKQYSDAIKNNDAKTLKALLEEGSKRKEEVDG